MGIEAGAEMTTLEMRMVALRCRGTLAPTGTLALGAGASQVNSLGERYEDSYGRTTSQRVLALRREMAAGRGPCFLSFKASKEAMEGLCRAYLDMSPTQALKWLESEESFGAEARAELEASEPYVMGGHTGGGFKIDQGRRASLEGLFAAGDAAGGCPQKFATGSMAEGAMAAESVASYLAGRPALPSPEEMGRLSERAIESIAAHLGEPKKGAKTAGELESGLLSLMDQKAGGAWAGYAYDLGGLGQALLELKELKLEAQKLRAKTPRGLSGIIELSRRLTLSESLVRHLRAREETRWPGFGEFKSFPGLSSGPPYEVVSALSPSGIETFRRPLSEGG
jgi:adenylylsulfate reductase subunit A